LGTFITSKAQVEVTIKSFELESQSKHKEWKIIEVGRTPANEIYIKFGKPICYVIIVGCFWCGSREYRGFKWDIDKLYFTDGFDYVKTESINIPSSEEAVLKNENVFGKTFKPLLTKVLGALIRSSSGMHSDQ
jgi:hypothetical protein